MAYTKTSWDASTALTIARLDNLESQYDLAMVDYVAHVHTDTFYTKQQMDSGFWGPHNDGHGGGSDADLLYASIGNQHGAAFEGMATPTGIIIQWFGSSANIPEGWNLCTGASGTPDMRDRFVVGAGSAYAVGATGGATTFTASGSITISSHTISINEIPSHAHTYLDVHHHDWLLALSDVWGSTRAGPRYATTTTAGGGQAHGHTGSSISINEVSSLPQYFALCFLQKV